MAVGSPTGLRQTAPGNNYMPLAWDENTEPSLAGYNVYRNGVKVNTSLITMAAYTNTMTASEAGITFTYTVTAVDVDTTESAHSDSIDVTTDGHQLFHLYAPEAVYSDRFTLRWSKYLGTLFSSYDVYLRPSEAYPENWRPSGSTDLLTSISDKNTLSYIVTGLTPQTEYDVCIVVSRTDGARCYTYRSMDSAVWTHATGIVNFIGGAHHVNTTAENELAMAIDSDIYNKPYLFSPLGGKIRSCVNATTPFFPANEVTFSPSSVRFSRPARMKIGSGYASATQGVNGGAWGFGGHFTQKEDGTIWDERYDVSGTKHRINATVVTSDDLVSWSDREFVTDLGVLQNRHLIAGAGKPITLSDDSGLLPLYVSDVMTSAQRLNSLVLLRSTDNGRTFVDSAEANNTEGVWGYIWKHPDGQDGPWKYCGEPAIVKIGGTFPDEHIVAAFRPNSIPDIVLAQSIDSGRTFTYPTVCTTIGDEISPRHFGMSSPQLHYDGVSLYLLIGNRASTPMWPLLDPSSAGAYLFKMPYVYSDNEGTPNPIPNLNANWSNGLRLGGNAATSNFDICYYGDVTSINSSTLICSYYECVGSPRTYEYGEYRPWVSTAEWYGQPTIDYNSGVQELPQTSMPYIGMRIVDKSTMTFISPDKTVQAFNADPLLSVKEREFGVDLFWTGDLTIYRSSTPGVTTSSTIAYGPITTAIGGGAYLGVYLPNDKGCFVDDPAPGRWYYRAYNGSSWSDEIAVLHKSAYDVEANWDAGHIDVTWTASTGVTGFGIERSTNSGEWVYITTTGGSSYQDSNVDPRYTYQYRVYGYYQSLISFPHESNKVIPSVSLGLFINGTVGEIDGTPIDSSYIASLSGPGDTKEIFYRGLTEDFVSIDGLPIECPSGVEVSFDGGNTYATSGIGDPASSTNKSFILRQVSYGDAQALAVPAPFMLWQYQPNGRYASYDFEDAVAGSSSMTGIVVSGSPYSLTCDDSIAHDGSKSMRIEGPTSTTYAGARYDSIVGPDIEEARFWLYADGANYGFRTIVSRGSSTTQILYIQLANNGSMTVYRNVDVPGYPFGYSTLGSGTSWTQYSYPKNTWIQFRVSEIDYTNSRYKLSYRYDEASAFTYLRSSTAPNDWIPFRGEGSITEWTSMVFASYGSTTPSDRVVTHIDGIEIAGYPL